ncbi:uncharacterized protein LOC129957656 isoform X1 [Argiope bruennichi]|uniref:uncharacterized protein LOC129957656 isoform X1 n=1 Tax=Argiope bruennichi TaxID=94029 RepID=UPI002495A0F8|nr:uncharacterized protein LOC129957656 isoform X1 [Argiope bruennichi]
MKTILKHFSQPSRYPCLRSFSLISEVTEQLFRRVQDFGDGKEVKVTMEDSNAEDRKPSSSSSCSRRLSRTAKSSWRISSSNTRPSPFLETTFEWLRSLTPKKLQEYEQEDAKEHRSGVSSAETLIKKKKILTVHTEDPPSHRRTLNLYEAFGTTAKKTAPGSGLQPLLVVEVNENGMLKRNHVPYKYSMEGKWLLYGKHIYVLKGHAFIEHKSSPTFVSCLLCVTTGFRMPQNFFQCVDCEYVCNNLQEASVTEDCAVAKILTQEMNFPYDTVESKVEKVNFL